MSDPTPAPPETPNTTRLIDGLWWTHPDTVAALRARLERAEADVERKELHFRRMLGLVERGVDEHVSKEFGGNAPEDVQGILDGLHRIRRERDEARADADRRVAEARREALREAARVADTEEEPDPMPPRELTKEEVGKLALAVVRCTKRNIAVRIRSLEEAPRAD